MLTFNDLNLSPSLLKAVADQNYVHPTPIQEQAIPPLLDGRDVLGCAQTGTGKTAAFSLPIIQHLEGLTGGRRPIRALILSPTRELAAQIDDAISGYAKYTDLRHTVIFGGVNQNPQVAKARRGLDILTATPGRLLDLIGQGHINLSEVEFFVLDEADRMLDMGFIHDIKKVLKLLPGVRQNLLFSATMPDSIVKLAMSFLHDPIRVEVSPEQPTVERIEQKVMFVRKGDKKELIVDLLRDSEVDSAIVFTRTKHGANRLTKVLSRSGIDAAAIHGNKSQNARERALAGFRSGDIWVLVATDIAARGIDVEGVSHIFNYDLPNEPETYVHRIGRTARAGRSGIAISFCDDGEGAYLRDIERLTGSEIPVDTDHDWHDQACVPGRNPKPPPRPGRGRGEGRREGGRPGGRRRQHHGPRKDRPRHEGASSPAKGSSGSQGGDASAGSANDGAGANAGGEGQRRRRRRKPAPGVATSSSSGGGQARSNSSGGGHTSAGGGTSTDGGPPRRRRRRSGSGGTSQ